MTIKIVNLTQQSVGRKIEETLKQSNECADSQVFANTDLQQKLTTYVLKRVHNCYVAVEPGQEATLKEMVNAELQYPQLDSLIRQGMDALLQSPTCWLQQHMLQTIDGSQIATEPSRWFG